jgi:hypothetical protein
MEGTFRSGDRKSYEKTLIDATNSINRQFFYFDFLKDHGFLLFTLVIDTGSNCVVFFSVTNFTDIF